jgi:LysR family transcriptional regulator, glycine cleavage system transcriptional activator
VHEELRGGFDVAVRRGSAKDKAWPQHRATYILVDIDTLVISPALFARRPIHEPADIAGHVLLAPETDLEIGLTGWIPPGYRKWRRNADSRGTHYCPATEHLVPRTGYVALVPFDAEKSATFKGFIDWLVAEGNPTTHPAEI